MIVFYSILTSAIIFQKEHVNLNKTLAFFKNFRHSLHIFHYTRHN